MKFYRLVLVSVIVFFYSNNLIAQIKKNDFYLRTNLLSFIEPDAGITLGGEYFLSQHFSLGVDVGVILYKTIDFEERRNLGHPIGYKIKPEIRYYFNKNKTTDKAKMFLAIEGLFLKNTKKNYTALDIRDNNGTFLYQYLGGFNEIKKVKALVVKTGVQIPRFIFKKMKIEFYAGLGVRKKSFSNKDTPAGATFTIPRGGTFIIDTHTQEAFPTIAAGFKLVYKLN
ncbi:MAG: DUF3575 domain-containing protein [Ferruginibacter sp.]|nr:DUF3575 domain-containing protein [Ferruginibacter sp.]